MAKLAPETERLASPVAPKGIHGKGLAQDGLSPFTKGNQYLVTVSRVLSIVSFACSHTNVVKSLAALVAA